MPRAFLITHRRYNATEDFDTPGREYSPERGVRLAGYGGGQPTSDGASDCGSETSSECPEELYNLTKLAEVSLAAAAGTLIHPGSNVSSRCYPEDGRTYVDRWDHRRRRIDEQSSTSSTSSRKQTVVQTSEVSRKVETRNEGRLEVTSRETCNEGRSEVTASETNSQGRLEVTGEETSNGGRLEVTSSETREMSLRERTRLFFERIESEILENRNSSRVETRDQNSVKNDRENEVPSKNLRQDEEIRQQQRTVLTLSRKSNSVSSSSTFSSPSSSSSEGSKSDDSEDHECPDCGKKYSTSSNLARHRQTHRSLGDKKARRCPHCDKIYVSMPAYSMHVRTHNQGCKCHYCGKCFSRPWLLQGHIRTHTGEKPFKCTICNKAFADKSNLRAHVQTHSNTKPHVCGRCGKAFALKSYLYKHEESSCTRAHNRGSSSEKRETSTSGSSASAQNVRVAETPSITASPTSVIVQCPSGSRTIVEPPQSTIIRHTKNPSICCDQVQSSSKRQCRESTTSSTEVPENAISNNNNSHKQSEYLSRMVIRTSVISPNPEHLVRLGTTGGTLNVKKSTYDFANPARTSAFSRPISLNLAIA